MELLKNWPSPRSIKSEYWGWTQDNIIVKNLSDSTAKPGLRTTELDNKTNECYSKRITILKDNQSANDTYIIAHILSFNT